MLLSSSTNITNCPAQLNRFLEEGSVQLLPTDQSYQVGSQNSITRTSFWKFACCQNCYRWSCCSGCYSTSGELQEADDKRDQLGEGHLHVAAQRRQERCWCHLWKVSFVFLPNFSMCILCICLSKMRQRCRQTFGENENVLRICLQIRNTRWSNKDISCKTQCSGSRHQAMLSTRWGRLPWSSFFLIIVNNNNINVNNNKIMPSTCWEGYHGARSFWLVLLAVSTTTSM